ncbi:MAG TPA: hypothetical protein VIV40_42060 [Kofleriaceae bacterium]
MDKARLQTARHRLIALHKAIIDAERVDLERVEGRLTGGAMLQRLVSDSRFAWLRALSEVIVRFDELLEAETLDDAEGCITTALRLLTPGEGVADAFHTEYARLLQDSPDVVMAHAAATGALRTGT